jgi:hypothetical protein
MPRRYSPPTRLIVVISLNMRWIPRRQFPVDGAKCHLKMELGQVADVRRAELLRETGANHAIGGEKRALREIREIWSHCGVN